MFNFTKHKGKKHFCMNCLPCFYSNASLAKHRVYCDEVQAINLPPKYTDKNGKERSPCVYFKNYNKKLPFPFCIVADFEANPEKLSRFQPSDDKPSDDKSYTYKYQSKDAMNKSWIHYAS